MGKYNKANQNFFYHGRSKPKQILCGQIITDGLLTATEVKKFKEMGYIVPASERDIAKWEYAHGKIEEKEEEKPVEPETKTAKAKKGDEDADKETEKDE